MSDKALVVHLSVLAAALFAIILIYEAVYPREAYRSPRGVCLLDASRTSPWSRGAFYIPCSKAGAYPELMNTRWRKEV